MRNSNPRRRRAVYVTRVLAVSALSLLAAGCDVFTSKEERLEQARADIVAGNYNAATLKLRRVLESSPDDAAARLALAEASLALGDLQAADTELRRAIAAGSPPSPTAALEGQVMLASGEAAQLLGNPVADHAPLPRRARRDQ